MITDPISDMLTQIRNALAVQQPEVVLPYSKLKENLAKLLEIQGWLLAVSAEELERRKVLRLKLRYHVTGSPAISGLKRVSKPGQRIYAKFSEIPRLRLGVGATILSTSQGLMTDKQARQAKLGGEVICQIW